MKCRTIAALALLAGAAALPGCLGEPNPGPPQVTRKSSAASVERPFGTPKNQAHKAPRRSSAKTIDTSKFPPK
jgi:hypothetical protein